VGPFFLEGSRQLKLLWDGLPIQGAESAGRTSSHMGIMRMIQREDLATSNRLPRFLIRACFRAISVGEFSQKSRSCVASLFFWEFLVGNVFGNCGW